MITVHGSDLLVGGIVWLAGSTVLFFICRAYLDARVDSRVLALFEQYLTTCDIEAASQPAHQPAPPWMAAETDYHYLPEPVLPPVKTAWEPFPTRADGSKCEDTISFRAIGFTIPAPEPKAEIAEEPKPEPRARFEPDPPAPPVTVPLTVTLPDPVAPGLPGQVITSEIEVAS